MTQRQKKMYTIHQKLTLIYGKFYGNFHHFHRPQKKSAFRKAEKYIIFLANMTLILQSGSYLLRYSNAKVKRMYSYNNHEKKVT